MSERTPNPDAQARLNSGPYDPLTIEKVDGRVWYINQPQPGRITVREADGRLEEHELASYLEQERARARG